MAKLTSTKRGKSAIAAIIAAAVGGMVVMSSTVVRNDVALAARHLVSPWEGRELRAYPDPATGGAPWTICDGDTKGVKPGMVETPGGCDQRLVRRMAEFRAQLVRCIPDFDKKPLSWRAMMNSLSYNIGTGAACRSTAARLGIAGRFVESCNAATAFNKAAGRVFVGLVNRREMGDARRIGEGELCVSGL